MDSLRTPEGKYGFWNRFILAYNIDPHKYEKKGYFVYLGYLLLVSYFTILPEFFEYLLPWIQQHIPQKLIASFGMIVGNLIITLFYNLAMYYIYKAKIPFFERFRVNQTPWPWQSNYQEWMKLLKKSVVFFIINNVIISVPMAWLDSQNSNYLTSFESIPDKKTILWQFTFFLLVEDFSFYLFHMMFHHPKLYWIHKSHHEYTNTIAFAAQTAHPLQAITGSSIPLILGFKILSQFTGVHVISIWVFFTFRIIEGWDSHSGYEWGWAPAELLPFNSGSAYHSFHHSHNVGNYTSFFKFWDTLFGTNTQYIKLKAKLKNRLERWQTFNILPLQ